MKSYEELIEAKEELDDIRTFDESINPALEAFRSGNAVTLKKYQQHRKTKAR